MTAHRDTVTSLRLERLDTTRLVRALVFSVLVHLLCWGGYTLNKKYQILERLGLPALIKKLTPALLKKPAPVSKPITQETEPPLVFVNVNPDTATPEPPKDALYYSSLNSKAANPDPERDTATPKLSGKQEHVPETETVERNKFDRLQPSPPAQEPQVEERAKPKQAPGDLAMAKPDLNPRSEPGNAEKKRVRTIAEAFAQKGINPPPSQKMKQEGGVRRRLELSSLDAKATPFGEYDRLLIDAVRSKWYDLLDARNYIGGTPGKVILRFHLNYKGQITDMTEVENTVSGTLGYLCQSAVMSPGPFGEWPREMRLLVGKDFREIQFTFYYD